jgi:hypothetical protein
MPVLDSEYSGIYSAFLFLRSCRKTDEPISFLDMCEYLKHYKFDKDYFFSIIKYLDSIYND